MVTRDKAWPSGTPCWVDLAVDDMARARTFYSRLFGWDIQPGPREAGGDTLWLKDGHPGGRVAPQQGAPGAPSVRARYLPPAGAGQTGRTGAPARRPHPP